MQRSHRKEPSQRAPVSRRLNWDALWRYPYRLLQCKYARGWQPTDWEDLAQEGRVRVVTALEAGVGCLAQRMRAAG